MADTPHFALPFRFAADGSRAVEVAQESDEEIAACIVAIISYPEGFRPELPDFGVAEQAFEQGGPHLQEIRAALAAWEPRADVQLELTDERLVDFCARVRLGFDHGSVG